MIKRCWLGPFLKTLPSGKMACKKLGRIITTEDCFACKKQIFKEEVKESPLPKVTFVCDRPGWAYDIASSNISEALSGVFNFSKVFNYKTNFYEEKAFTEADVVIFHHIGTAFQPENKKVIVKVSGHRCLDYILKKKNGEQRLENLIRDRNVVCVCEELVDRVKKYTDRITVIPNGLDLTRFKPRAPKLGDFTIGFCACVSNLQRVNYKGYSFVDVVAEHMNLPLKALTYDAKANTPSLTYDAMHKFYSSISCLVHPSKGEGSSNVIMEALASGVPVITTKTGYHGQELEHDKNVLFVPRNVFDITWAVTRLKTTPKLYEVLSTEGRKFAEERHDINKVALLWKKVIEEAK